MNLKFWQHKKTKEVISPECRKKLPFIYHEEYEPTHFEPTHRVEESGGDFLTTLIAVEAISSLVSSDNSSSYDSNSSGSDYSSSDSYSSSSDFGGGGSGSDF